METSQQQKEKKLKYESGSLPKMNQLMIDCVYLYINFKIKFTLQYITISSLHFSLYSTHTIPQPQLFHSKTAQIQEKCGTICGWPEFNLNLRLRIQLGEKLLCG